MSKTNEERLAQIRAAAAPKVVRKKKAKGPRHVNPKGIRVMILREGKIKWGWM